MGFMKKQYKMKNWKDIFKINKIKRNKIKNK